MLTPCMSRYRLPTEASKVSGDGAPNERAEIDENIIMRRISRRGWMQLESSFIYLSCWFDGSESTSETMPFLAIRKSREAKSVGACFRISFTGTGWVDAA